VVCQEMSKLQKKELFKPFNQQELLMSVSPFIIHRITVLPQTFHQTVTEYAVIRVPCLQNNKLKKIVGHLDFL
jgi:hypothetical protein